MTGKIVFAAAALVLLAGCVPYYYYDRHGYDRSGYYAGGYDGDDYYGYGDGYSGDGTYPGGYHGQYRRGYNAYRPPNRPGYSYSYRRDRWRYYDPYYERY